MACELCHAETSHPPFCAAYQPGRIFSLEIVVFDLDGTISDDRHRAHHVEGLDEPDWDTYYGGIIDDTPVLGAVALHHIVKPHFGIHHLTGRSEQYRNPTRTWLLNQGLAGDFLHMRDNGDRRRNPVYKRAAIEALLEAGYNIRLVVDDHPGVEEAIADLCPVLTVRGFRGEGEHVATRSTW